MKAVMLYRPKSAHGRTCESYVRDFEKQTNKQIDVMDYDSREGAAFAEARDIVAIPALVITDDMGSVIKQWLGDALPLFNEAAAYLRDGS